MESTGRLIWIGSAVAFVAVALFFPTTVRTDLPSYAGARLDFSREIINIPAVRWQLLLGIALAATFVAGVVMDVAARTAATILGVDGARDAAKTPPLLKRDADGDADISHLADLGIIRTEEGWTYDGQAMPGWSDTIRRGIDEGRFRLS